MQNMQIEIIQGSCQKIYQIGTVQYDIHFPLHWALEPKQLEDGFVCGPSYCNNCLEYGSYRGVFIGYCLNCAYEYGYERGNGFLYHGVECLVGNGREAKNSVWNTYLKNVNLEDIGWNSWVEPPFVDDWVSEAEEHEVEENLEEKEDKMFHEVDSVISDDESEYDDYHDFVDSESEYFERMYVARSYVPRKSIYDRITVKM